MGTLLMYMIVIALLVMVYLLWEIRTAITNMSGQLGALVRTQRVSYTHLTLPTIYSV